MTEAAFPPYPVVGDLPAKMTTEQQREFALTLIAEHGAALGDYLFAAVRQASDRDAQMRWVEMTALVDSLHDGPVYLSYRACDRIEAEAAAADVAG